MNALSIPSLRLAALAMALSPAIAFSETPSSRQQTQPPPEMQTQQQSQPGQQTQPQGQTPTAPPGQQMQQQQAQQQQQQPPVVLDDVKALNDASDELTGQRVSVRGEVQESPAPGMIVLESGGWFGDEITVVIPDNVKTDPSLLQDDASLQVTGRVVTTSIVEIERDLGWDLDREVEIEFEGNRTYLIADQVVDGTS